MNGVPPAPEAPPELPDPDDPVDPEADDAADCAALAAAAPPPTFTIAPTGVIAVGVPTSETVPVAWMPVTSS
jgi:hypothetical protein